MIWICHIFVIIFLVVVSYFMKSKNTLIITTYIYSLTIFGQRWLTGEDFPGYLLYYIINFQGSDWSYFALQDLFIKNNLSFSLLIFLAYALTLFLNYKFIISINRNIFLLIFLYSIFELYFIQLSQIRQFIAISLFLNALYYAHTVKYFKMVVFTILAVSFHISTILVVPFLFFKKQINRKFLFIISLTLIFLPVFDITIFLEILNVNFYSNYLGGEYDQDLSAFHLFKYFILLSLLLIIIKYSKRIYEDNMDIMIVTGFIFYLFFYGISFQYAPMLRVANFFRIFEILILATQYSRIRLLDKKLTLMILIGMYIIFYIGIALIDPYNISRYEFRLLHLFERESLYFYISEIERFYFEKR